MFTEINKLTEKSESNRIRSVRVLYEGGLMSKRKYNTIRKCPIEIMQDCHAPNILPYKTLSKFIKTVDIGDVKDLREFCMEAGFNPVSGVYRSLKPLLVQLATSTSTSTLFSIFLYQDQ